MHLSTVVTEVTVSALPDFYVRTAREGKMQAHGRDNDALIALCHGPDTARNALNLSHALPAFERRAWGAGDRSCRYAHAHVFVSVGAASHRRFRGPATGQEDPR